MLQDTAFAQEFMDAGGIPALMSVATTVSGNTQTYAIAAVRTLIRQTSGTYCCCCCKGSDIVATAALIFMGIHVDRCRSLHGHGVSGTDLNFGRFSPSNCFQVRSDSHAIHHRL